MLNAQDLRLGRYNFAARMTSPPDRGSFGPRVVLRRTDDGGKAADVCVKVPARGQGVPTSWGTCRGALLGQGIR